MSGDQEAVSASPQVQKAVNSYLWAVEACNGHDLAWNTIEKLAQLAFEAELQVEIHLLNIMAVQAGMKQ